MILPALSVRQPWAIAITQLGKDIENRMWRGAPSYRGPILIHASKGLTLNEYTEGVIHGMPDGVDIGRLPSFEAVERGGIVGACELYDVGAPLAEEEGWAQAGALRLLLRKQIALPFRAYKGALGFFKVEITPAEQEALCAAGIVK